MSKTEVPCVSVCIPSYCGAPHLAATIESVLEQSFHDFELIIIDDNSPDETSDIVGLYDDPRIRYLCNETNLGPEGNWNRCLEEARGQYFKLLPQDDRLYPDTLKRQVSILEEDRTHQLALVFGARDIVDSRGKILTQRGYPTKKEGVIDGGGIVRRCVRRGTNLIGEPGGVLMRKALTEKVGFFDGDIGYIIDLDYWVRLLKYGDAYYMQSPVSDFRISSGSWSVDIGTRQSRQYCDFIGKLRDQPDLQISKLDVKIGNFAARVNNFLRLVFYKLVIWK